MTTRSAPVPGSFESYLPRHLRSDGPYGEHVDQAKRVYRHIKNFIELNRAWLGEGTGGIKILFIKFPEAIVSISNRMGPATHLPGKMVNFAAVVLTPIHKLGADTSALLGFVDVAFKFPDMFAVSRKMVRYVVKDNDSDAYYHAQFPLNKWEQRANSVHAIANWTLNATACAGYLWKLNHTPLEDFPLASFATWTGRFMNLKGIYSEGRFLYETLWVGAPQQYLMVGGEGKYAPVKHWDKAQKKFVPIENTSLAKAELVGSLLRLSMCVASLSIDVLKAMAAKGNNPKWLDNAVFCAGLAPTFITPLAAYWWPKMAIEPLHVHAVATA